MWWHMPVISVLERVKQESCKFKPSLEDKVALQKKKKNQTSRASTMVVHACNPSYVGKNMWPYQKNS
jgi:hypothetical protein